MRQHVPLAAGFQHVEDRVEDLAQVGAARTSTQFGAGEIPFQDFPFGVGQVTGVRFCSHSSTLICLTHFSNGLLVVHSVNGGRIGAKKEDGRCLADYRCANGVRTSVKSSSRSPALERRRYA